MVKNAETVQNKEIVPAEEIPSDPDFRKLGTSSQHLSVHDFDLMRTLGTGETGWTRVAQTPGAD